MKSIYFKGFILIVISVFCVKVYKKNSFSSLKLSSKSYSPIYKFSHKPFNPKEDELTFKKLEQILIENNISSIDSLLKYLSENFNEHLSVHTFSYNSKSLQTSDFQNPRAIVFGVNANFIFTFNQKSDLKNHTGTDAIETMSYSEETRSFNFREIRFLEDSTENVDIFKGKGHYITEPNPMKCLACHSASYSMKKPFHNKDGSVAYNTFVRPVWDAYFLWRNIYGGVDDNLNYDFALKEHLNDSYSTPLPRKIFGIGVELKEHSEYAKFTGSKGNRKTGRYKYLPKLSIKAPNLRLSLLLSTKNNKRIARRLKVMGGDQLLLYKYNLIYPFLCDFPLSSSSFDQRLFNSELEEYKIFKKAFDENIYESKSKIIEHFEAFENKVVKNSLQPSKTYFSTHSLAPVFYLAQKFGIPTADWSMAPFKDMNLFSDGRKSFRTFIALALIDELFLDHEKDELINSVNELNCPDSIKDKIKVL